MKKIIIILAIVVLLISMANGAIQPNEKKVNDVREKHEAKLFTIEGVSGVSHNENEIIVYLEKPEISKKVPKVLDGIPVRFEVTGRIDALQAVAIQEPVILDQTPYIRTDQQSPVFGGISVGNPLITAGTLGMVVIGPNEKKYVLSNAHVLALKSKPTEFLPIDTEILQPGPYDGGSDVIGYLHKYIPIEFNSRGANNYADAAISTLTEDQDVVPGKILDEENTGFYQISGTTDVFIGDTVRKSGRTTGVTENTVLDTGVSVKVGYRGKYAIFKDQILVSQPFSLGGDSGSVVDKKGAFVGLVFAGGSSHTIVCKAKYIIEDLEITVSNEKKDSLI